jgi:hypothetical protein
MDKTNKLEQYLDQVCRGIAGPRSLRQHIRQELREHLIDSAEEFRAAGLPEEESLARALEDFGGPEQVRSELEATHGHRLMTVVIDKAMQWKEDTMKAKWLWSTWAHLALGLVIVIEVLFVLSALVFIVPKYHQYIQDGWLDFEHPTAAAIVTKSVSFFNGMATVAEMWVRWVIPLAIAWGLAEWRVRSERKSFIRLSAMASAALVLIVVVACTAAALVLPLILALPNMRALPQEPTVRQQFEEIDTSLAALDVALADRNWPRAQSSAGSAMYAGWALTRVGAAAPTVVALRDQTDLNEVRAQLKSASDCLAEVYRATRKADMPRTRAAMENFRQVYAQIRGPTTRPQ